MRLERLANLSQFWPGVLEPLLHVQHHKITFMQSAGGKEAQLCFLSVKRPMLCATHGVQVPPAADGSKGGARAALPPASLGRPGVHGGACGRPGQQAAAHRRPAVGEDAQRRHAVIVYL